jgi:hypothetical protein
MTASVPASAAARVRATGASMNVTPALRELARQRAGEIDLRRAQIHNDLSGPRAAQDARG